MAAHNHIREVRKQKGISQEELAKSAGVGRRTLQYWENGTSVMPVDKAEKLLEILGETYTLGKTA